MPLGRASGIFRSPCNPISEFLIFAHRAPLRIRVADFLTVNTAMTDKAKGPEVPLTVHHLDLADSPIHNLEHVETEQGVPTTREVLEELYQLLEDYAPTWYTEAHHNRIVAALLGTRG